MEQIFNTIFFLFFFYIILICKNLAIWNVDYTAACI